MAEPGAIWTMAWGTEDEAGVLRACLYLFADLSGAAAEPTFDAIARRWVGGLEKYGPRHPEGLSLALAVLGVEPDDSGRVAEVDAAYNRMWERHPDLWELAQRGEPAFGLWIVDRLGRPFRGMVSGKVEGDFVVFSAEDVRETELYRELLPQLATRWLVMNIVQPDPLAQALRERP